MSWIKTRILCLNAGGEKEELMKNMKQRRDKGHKLVFNSIFNKVPKAIVLCSRHATAQKSHHGRGNGKKMSRGFPRSQGLNKYSEINNI